jgi:CheY-like chemotaxis protein
VTSNPRVLLVDADPELQELVGDTVEALGASLVVCRTSAEGLATASSESFDAILLDILMPGFSSYEICRRLKADPATSDVPIIFVTRPNHEDDILDGFEILAFDFLIKPFRPRELRARLQSAIRTKALLDELRSRVRLYERCFRVGRGLALAGSPEEAAQIVSRELADIVSCCAADGVSVSFAGAPDLFSFGRIDGPVAAELPVVQSNLSGVLRLYRSEPADPDERSRLADFAGTLMRGIRRSLGLTSWQHAATEEISEPSGAAARARDPEGDQSRASH